MRCLTVPLEINNFIERVYFKRWVRLPALIKMFSIWITIVYIGVKIGLITFSSLCKKEQEEFNMTIKKSKRDEYYEMFNDGVKFEDIELYFNVKKSTIFDYFIKYMVDHDFEKYEDLIFCELPCCSVCRDIENQLKFTSDFRTIKHKLSSSISYEQVRLVCTLLYLGRLNEFTLYNEDANLELDGKELFTFLDEHSQRSIKTTIGQFVSHNAIEWINIDKIIGIDEINSIDRKKLAIRFLNEEGRKRIFGKYYTLRYNPTDDEMINDIAIQIDYRIPVNYFIYKHDLEYGYEDHTVLRNKFKGIIYLNGVKYQYLENYIRESLFFERKKHSCIGYKANVIPFIKKELRGHDLEFCLDDISKEDARLVIDFIIHDIDFSMVQGIIRYI